MDDLPLPALPAGDPRNRLSVDALRRVERALMQAERIRWEVEAKVEGSGISEAKAKYRVDQACLKSVRIVLKVLAQEYADAGLTLKEFWGAMRLEIEGTVDSLRLTGIQQRYLETEFFIPPKQTEQLRSIRSVPEPVRLPSETVGPIGTQIDGLREESRLTVEDVAEALDVTPRSVYRHLSGEAVPRRRQIAAYEKLFSQKLGRKFSLKTSPKRQ